MFVGDGKGSVDNSFDCGIPSGIEFLNVWNINERDVTHLCLNCAIRAWPVPISTLSSTVALVWTKVSTLHSQPSDITLTLLALQLAFQ